MHKNYITKEIREEHYLKENLKFLRKSTGLSLEHMAHHLGLNAKNSYKAYEIGKAEPPINSLIKMARLFDVTIDDLIKKNLTKPV